MVRGWSWIVLLAACGGSSPAATDGAVDAQLYAHTELHKSPVPIASEHFGQAVALSGDGRTLAIADSGVTAANHNATGGVFIFERSGADWTQQAYLQPAVLQSSDAFGCALQLSDLGDTLVVGAYGEASGIAGNPSDHSRPGAGAAYVFKRHGTDWTQQAYLKASNADAGDVFGGAVAIAGDGNTVAIGAANEASSGNDPTDNSASEAGAVYVFVTDGTTWTPQVYLKAANAGAGDWFGMSLALAADGTMLVVGAPHEDSASSDPTDDTAMNAGAAYVFQRSGTAWAQTAYLKAATPAATAAFGGTVALSGLGTTLVIGAQNDPDGALAAAGSAYVLAFAGSWTQQARLAQAQPAAGQHFGGAAISGDGQIIAIREPSAAAGALALFSLRGSSWAPLAELPSFPGDPNNIGVPQLSSSGTVVIVGDEFESTTAKDSGAVVIHY